MSKALQWIIGIGVVLLVASVIISSIAPFFLPRTAWGGYGMMGPGQMYGGGGMMGGLGMGFFGMLLWPLLFIGLIVVGGMWLVRNMAAPTPPQPLAAGPACSHCGKPLQAGWKACPSCGEKV